MVKPITDAKMADTIRSIIPLHLIISMVFMLLGFTVWNGFYVIGIFEGIMIFLTYWFTREGHEIWNS